MFEILLIPGLILLMGLGICYLDELDKKENKEG